MRLLSCWSRLPRNPGLVEAVDSAGARLRDKLSALSPQSMGLSPFAQSFLEKHLGELSIELNIYGFILCWALHPHRKPLERTVLVDYGGGCGLLSLYARELGVGRVVFNDIYDDACLNARRIAAAVGLAADRYVPGEIAELAGALAKDGTACDAVVSYDVIEHVYDIDSFLRSLARLSPGPFSVLMASSANERNPRLRRMLMAKQRAIESHDRVIERGHVPRDCVEPYLEARRKIVVGVAPDLAPDAIDRLARLTRGLREDDIRAAVERFRASGEWPREIGHPTNTCDPYTGNWTEQLLDQGRLCRGLEAEGMRAETLPGCYGRFNAPTLRAASWVMNPLTRLPGSLGMSFAPFFALYGTKGF